MDLTHRQAELRDVEACADLLVVLPPYEGCSTSDLSGALRRLLEARSIIFELVEDLERTSEARLVGIGASVFVTDEFVCEVKASHEPYVGRRIYRLTLEGRSPVLCRQALRRANSGQGLNAFVLHHDVAPDVADPDRIALVRLELSRAFIGRLRGFNLKEILAEGVGEEDFRWAIGSGSFHLRDDYRDHVESRPKGLQGGPFLAGMTREEALSVEGVGTMLAPLFAYTAPSFFFREREQELLELALSGEADQGIAWKLNISLSAVKKRWESVFDRVAAVQADLLPLKTEDKPLRQTRGPEKRQRLLQYLQQHPEELRPVEPPERLT